MNKALYLGGAAIILAGALWLAQLANANPGHHEGHGAGQADAVKLELEPNREREYFTDLPLVDQHGRSLRFYSDVLQDRIVLINFMFTDCPEFCPMLTRKLKEVRNALGEEMRDEILFVSLSTDPTRDTPEVLRAFMERNGIAAEQSWVFLTGEEENVRAVLRRLGETSQDPAAHLTLLLAGNVNTRNWAKIMPNAPPVAIAMKLEELAGTPLEQSLR